MICLAGTVTRFAVLMSSGPGKSDRKSTRLNSSHTEIYTLSLHDALPIFNQKNAFCAGHEILNDLLGGHSNAICCPDVIRSRQIRSEEHTSELQSHRDLHSFPTRRSSDLQPEERVLRWP